MILPEEIRSYVERHQPPLPPLLEKLREETAALPDGRMIFSRDSARLVGLLVRAIEARRALEIGTFTGFSSLVIALALPADGKLVACDVSEEWTAIARRYWREAGVEGRIELRLAPASRTLAALLREGARGSFDFALIDADKSGYPEYYERCLELLRPGGLLAVDNTLWGGQVADERAQDADTRAIRSLNRRIREDDRVEACLLTIGDGLAVARKL
jgi:predicted O-methyltransferase YrrM